MAERDVPNAAWKLITKNLQRSATCTQVNPTNIQRRSQPRRRSAHHQLPPSAKATTSKDANKNKSAHATQQSSNSEELSTDTTYTRTHHNGVLATSRADERGENMFDAQTTLWRGAESDTKLCLQLPTRQSSFHPALKTAPSSHHSEREFLHTGPSTGLVMAIQKHRLQKPLTLLQEHDTPWVACKTPNLRFHSRWDDQTAGACGHAGETSTGQARMGSCGRQQHPKNIFKRMPSR